MFTLVGCFDRLNYRDDDALLTLKLTGTVIDHTSTYNPAQRSLPNAENLYEVQSS